MSGLEMFAGIHAVLYALFAPDEALDFDAMGRQVDYCVATGCSGVTVLGLATEVLKLTPAERQALVRSVGLANGGRLRFSVTVAGNSVAEQVDLARFAQDHGADWLILQPPIAGSYGADVYLRFFERVAASVSIPVAIQNAPQYLGRGLSADDLARLLGRCPNVVAVKSEEPAIAIDRLVALVGDRMAVLAGRGALEMTDSLRAGCHGFVLAPDIAPVAVRIFSAWAAGRTEAAEALYAQAVPAATFVMQSLEHLVVYGKRIFAGQAGVTVHDRAPSLSTTAFGLATADRWASHLRNLAGEPM